MSVPLNARRRASHARRTRSPLRTLFSSARRWITVQPQSRHCMGSARPLAETATVRWPSITCAVPAWQLRGCDRSAATHRDPGNADDERRRPSYLPINGKTPNTIHLLGLGVARTLAPATVAAKQRPSRISTDDDRVTKPATRDTCRRSMTVKRAYRQRNKSVGQRAGYRRWRATDRPLCACRTAGSTQYARRTTDADRRPGHRSSISLCCAPTYSACENSDVRPTVDPRSAKLRASRACLAVSLAPRATAANV